MGSGGVRRQHGGALASLSRDFYPRQAISKADGRHEIHSFAGIFVGKKAKTIVLHTFCIVDDDGDEAGGYGHWLKKTGLYKLPYIFDVFCGKLSFIGVKRLSFADAAFVSEADEGRYAVRAGLINPLVTTGNGETDYKEMFSSDLSYAKSLSLFGDLKIFLRLAPQKNPRQKRYLAGRDGV